MNYELARASVLRENRPYVYAARYSDGTYYIGSSASGLKHQRMWPQRLYAQKQKGAVDFQLEFFDTEEQARNRENAKIQQFRAQDVPLHNLKVPKPKIVKARGAGPNPKFRPNSFQARMQRSGHAPSDFLLEA